MSTVNGKTEAVAPQMTDLMFGLSQGIHKSGFAYLPPAVVNTLLLNVCIDGQIQPDQLPPELYELFEESREREKLAAGGGELNPYIATGLLHTVGEVCTQLMRVDNFR